MIVDLFFKALFSEEPDSFFEEWYRDCMVENHVAKNPDVIINRCDSNKVELLLNQYMQADGELKTRLQVDISRSGLLSDFSDNFNYYFVCLLTPPV